MSSAVCVFAVCWMPCLDDSVPLVILSSVVDDRPHAFLSLHLYCWYHWMFLCFSLLCLFFIYWSGHRTYTFSRLWYVLTWEFASHISNNCYVNLCRLFSLDLTFASQLRICSEPLVYSLVLLASLCSFAHQIFFSKKKKNLLLKLKILL